MVRRGVAWSDACLVNKDWLVSSVGFETSDQELAEELAQGGDGTVGSQLLSWLGDFVVYS